MYPVSITAGVGAGVGGLAVTGAPIGWQIVAAFTLLAVGLALLRVVPRRARTR